MRTTEAAMVHAQSLNPDDHRYRTPTPRPLWCGLVFAGAAAAALITLVVLVVRLLLVVV